MGIEEKLLGIAAVAFLIAVAWTELHTPTPIDLELKCAAVEENVIIRCTNDEVVCYAARSGISCGFKHGGAR